MTDKNPSSTSLISFVGGVAGKPKFSLSCIPPMPTSDVFPMMGELFVAWKCSEIVQILLPTGCSLLT